MDNQNNFNVNNEQENTNAETTTNVINQQTTNLPGVEISNTNTISNENKPQKEGGWFKTLFAFIFLVGMIVMVIMLPEISEFIESRKPKNTNTQSNVIQSGTLICTRKKASDNSNTDFEIKMIFNDRKLESAKYTTTIESYDTPDMIERKKKCDEAKNVSTNIKGLTMECRLNDTVYETIEKFELKEINTSELSTYTQFGGTYPEFKYGKDIYDIKTSMVKTGYDCEVTSEIAED